MSAAAIDPLKTYGVDELGRLVFDLCPDRAGRRISLLRQKHGFPPPIPGPGRKRWLGSAVIGWLQTPPAAGREEVPPPGASSDNLVDYGAVLQARLTRLREAAGGRQTRRP